MLSPAILLAWDVDTQVDFLDPAGKLYVPGAEKLISRIQRLNTWATSNRVQVVSSTDAHLSTDPEFQEYPLHCLVGTPGQKKVAGTTLPNHFTIPNRAINWPDDLSAFHQIIIEKQATDVFSNPNTEALLQRIAIGKEIVLYGVVTEICIDKAARGLIRRGHRLHIVTDAIQHLDETAAQTTLRYILDSGGGLVTTEQVVDQR
jgi:nicotinamidase/pyrazinamidase